MHLIKADERENKGFFADYSTKIWSLVEQKMEKQRINFISKLTKTGKKLAKTEREKVKKKRIRILNL